MRRGMRVGSYKNIGNNPIQELDLELDLLKRKEQIIRDQKKIIEDEREISKLKKQHIFDHNQSPSTYHTESLTHSQKLFNQPRLNDSQASFHNKGKYSNKGGAYKRPASDQPEWSGKKRIVGPTTGTPPPSGPSGITKAKKTSKNQCADDFILKAGLPIHPRATGRLEVALGNIVAEMRLQFCVPPYNLRFNSQDTKLIKAEIRARIHELMMGKMIPSCQEIVTLYRSKYPGYTDIELIKLYRTDPHKVQSIGEIAKKNRPQKTDEIFDYIKNSIQGKLCEKLDEIFKAVSKICKEQDKPLDETVEWMEAAEKESELNKQANLVVENSNEVDTIKDHEDQGSDISNTSTALKIVEDEKNYDESQQSEVKNQNINEDNEGNDEDISQQSAVNDQHINQDNEGQDEVVNRQNETTIQDISQQSAVNDQHINQDNEGQDEVVNRQNETTIQDISQQSAVNDQHINQDNEGKDDIVNRQNETTIQDINQQSQTIDLDNEQNEVINDEHIKDKNPEKPRPYSYYDHIITSMITQKIPEILPKYTNFIMKIIIQDREFINFLTNIHKEYTKNVDKSSNQKRSRELFVKVIAKPALPKRNIMQDFLKQFNPTSMKRHKHINNLLFIGVPSEEDLNAILAANETVIDNSKILISLTQTLEHKFNQEKFNNFLTNEVDNTGKEIVFFEDNVGNIDFNNALDEDMDTQITSLLTSIKDEI